MGKAHPLAPIALPLLLGGDIEIGTRVEGIDFRRLSKVRHGPVQLSRKSQRSTQVEGRADARPILDHDAGSIPVNLSHHIVDHEAGTRNQRPQHRRMQKEVEREPERW